jgi:GNAT superfamily N-acetyltransferase
MNHQAILDRLDYERRHLAMPGTTREMRDHVSRVSGPYHAVAWSSLTADNADAIIHHEIEHHRNLGVEFEWKLYTHDTPSDMLLRLQRHGFEIGPREAVLIYDLADPPQWLHLGTQSVRRVGNLDELEIYRRVINGLERESNESIISDLADALRAGSSHHRGYIAYDGDSPVSIGRLYTSPDSHFAGLYGGGTLPAFRGRGHYRALVAARARDALAAGARYLQVDALPTSRPILERLGFQWLTDTWPCEWRP